MFPPQHERWWHLSEWPEVVFVCCFLFTCWSLSAPWCPCCRACSRASALKLFVYCLSCLLFLLASVLTCTFSSSRSCLQPSACNHSASACGLPLASCVFSACGHPLALSCMLTNHAGQSYVATCGAPLVTLTHWLAVRRLSYVTPYVHRPTLSR